MTAATPKPRVLITGAQGFIGSHLMRTLEQAGFAPSGPVLDLFDFARLRQEIGEGGYAAVIHLAGLSHAASCEADPEAAYRANVSGTALVLEAMRAVAGQTRLIFASTAQVYSVPGTFTGTLTEESAIEPQNLYARTKWQAEVLIRDAVARERLRATVLRLFNHTHHSQPPQTFVPHLYSRLRAGAGDIPVGNLDLVRDLGSVADLLRAFEAVLNTPSALGTFNVCAGTPKNLRTIAERLSARLGVAARFVADPARFRPGEPVRVVGSHQKLTELTGWQPSCLSEEDLITAFLA